MRRAIRHTVLALMLATVAAAETPALGSPELEGLYAAAGINPDGSQYRGFVQIVPHGESFLVSWMSADAAGDAVVFAPVSVGIGIINGEMLAVSYYSARTAGIVIYRIEDAGKRLAGRWTVVGERGVVQTETLTRLPGEAMQPVEVDPPPPPRRRPSAGVDTSLSL